MRKRKLSLSLYASIIIPVMVGIILMLVGLCVLLWTNGTFEMLIKSSLHVLSATTESAAVKLENDMTRHFSNIGGLESDVADIVSDYMEETGLTAADLFADPDAYSPIDSKLADAVLGAIRFSNANGIFVAFSDGREGEVFTDENGDFAISDGNKHTLHCIHFRDLDPLSNPADFSDIIMERGKNAVAVEKNIPADSFWSADITVTPENVRAFGFHLKPILTARENPGYSPEYYGYWGEPRVLSNISGPETRDTYTYITYTMPIIVDGEVIGVVGSEVQVSFLTAQYLPDTDFEALGLGGYILAGYDASDVVITAPHSADALASEEMISLNPYLISGEEAEADLLSLPSLEVYRDVYNSWHMIDDSIFVFNRNHEDPAQTSHMSLYNLSLYDEDSPFYNERWAVGGGSPNDYLFAAPDNLWEDVLAVSALCVLFALLFMTIIVWFAVRPLNNLTDEVKAGATELSVPGTFDVKEIEVLRGALVDSYNKAKEDRQTLSEEQERFKLALSLATGTLLEYAPETDITKITRFDSESTPFVWTLEHTRDRLRDGGFVHPEDAPAVAALFSGKPSPPLVARINMRFLPRHIYGSTDDYAWIRFSCKIFTDGDGKFLRLIGTTQDVTADELRRERDILRMRTDPTTKLFNREYGFSQFTAALSAASAPMMLVQIALEPALICEAYYGLFYTNVVHFAVARRLGAIAPKGSILTRGGDNEIFILVPPMEDYRALLENITNIKDSIYVGENEEIKLAITAGAALSSAGSNIYELSGRTNAAIKYALEKCPGAYMFYADLPGNLRTAMPYVPTPITFNSDIASMSITAIAFNLFERTKDTPSVINMLSRLVARRFDLSRVFIVENDMDFLTNMVTYCYSVPGFPELTDRVSRVPREYYSDFDSFAHGDGMHIVTSRDNASDSIKTLLRVGNLAEYSVFACGMYVSGELAGKIVFTHADPGYIWKEELTNDLNEVTKIITSHLSRSKSDTASKAKTEFLSKISHEIRTPMNAIIGLSDIARKAEEGGNTARTLDCLKKIDGSAKFLLTIINDVLDMSKIESGKVSLSESPCDIVKTVEDVSEMLRPMVESRGMDFFCEIDVKTRFVICDGPRLGQVLTNLLGNAVKFTEAGFITLTVRETNGEYYFSVSDTGVGISEEDRSRVFDSFVQLDSSDKVYGGTGLGLSISSRIIKLMGGTIEVSSELGKGSKFYFTLPLEPAGSAEQKAEPEEKDYTGYFAGRRALLVEDNELNTEIATALLEDAGLEVITAENGEVGAKKYTEKPSGYFDVIFMDIRMPVLDGLGATRLIRRDETHADARTIPIVAMTANAFDDDMKKSLEAGMSGYLPKPIDIEKLYRMLDELLGQSGGIGTPQTDDSGQVI